MLGHLGLGLADWRQSIHPFGPDETRPGHGRSNPKHDVRTTPPLPWGKGHWQSNGMRWREHSPHEPLPMPGTRQGELTRDSNPIIMSHPVFSLIMAKGNGVDTRHHRVGQASTRTPPNRSGQHPPLRLSRVILPQSKQRTDIGKEDKTTLSVQFAG